MHRAVHRKQTQRVPSPATEEVMVDLEYGIQVTDQHAALVAIEVSPLDRVSVSQGCISGKAPCDA